MMARDYNQKRYRARSEGSKVDNSETVYMMWGKAVKERDEIRAELAVAEKQLAVLVLELSMVKGLLAKAQASLDEARQDRDYWQHKWGNGNG